MVFFFLLKYIQIAMCSGVSREFWVFSIKLHCNVKLREVEICPTTSLLSQILWQEEMATNYQFNTTNFLQLIYILGTYSYFYYKHLPHLNKVTIFKTPTYILLRCFIMTCEYFNETINMGASTHTNLFILPVKHGFSGEGKVWKQSKALYHCFLNFFFKSDYLPCISNGIQEGLEI